MAGTGGALKKIAGCNLQKMALKAGLVLRVALQMRGVSDCKAFKCSRDKQLNEITLFNSVAFIAWKVVLGGTQRNFVIMEEQEAGGCILRCPG